MQALFTGGACLRRVHETRITVGFHARVENPWPLVGEWESAPAYGAGLETLFSQAEAEARGTR